MDVVISAEALSSVRLGRCSHIGYRRTENQDRMVDFRTEMGELFVVADGMGGHRGGGTAATMVVEGFERNLRALPPGFTPRAALRAAARRTNAAICAAAEAGDPATARMGSTVVVLFVSRSQAFVGHIGDSRAYLFRQGKLSLLTRDHTLVQHLVDRGLITEAEARDHPDSSVLARAMGRRSDLDIEFSNNLVLDEGDSVLLCSDGLSGYVDDPEIAAVLADNRDPQAAAEALVEAALATGGYDNITVHVVTFTRRMVSASRGMRLASADGPGMADDCLRAAAPLEGTQQDGNGSAETGAVIDPAVLADTTPLSPPPAVSAARSRWITPALLAGTGLAVVALALAVGAWLLPDLRPLGRGVGTAAAPTAPAPPAASPADTAESAQHMPGERLAILLIAQDDASLDRLAARVLATGLQAKVIDRAGDREAGLTLLPGTVYFQAGYEGPAVELAKRLGFGCQRLADNLMERCRRGVVVVAARSTATAAPADDHSDTR